MGVALLRRARATRGLGAYWGWCEREPSGFGRSYNQGNMKGLSALTHKKRMTVRAVEIGTAAVCLLMSAACDVRGVTVEYRSGYSFSRTERKTIEAVVDQAVADARKLLPELPTKLRITVQTSHRVIPETGETAEIGLPGAVYWTVNPMHDPGGVVAIANAQLRATLFHELYHLVREAKVRPVSLADRAVNEGLATAFERDQGAGPVPWAAYPGNVADWTEEFLALPNDAPHDVWMFRHPDGRRWIGFKVGTYLADQAVQRSGLSLTQLVTVPTGQIIHWARRPE
jgi:hypothetical protein